MNKRKRGLTLLELMLATGTLFIVTFGAFAVTRGMGLSYNKSVDRLTENQVRYRIYRQVYEAINSASAVTITNATNITLTIPTDVGTGTKTVKVYLGSDKNTPSSTAKSLYMKTGSSDGVLLATNVNSIAFTADTKDSLTFNASVKSAINGVNFPVVGTAQLRNYK